MKVQIRRPVPLTINGHRRLHTRGSQVDIADEIAARLIAQGRADALAPTAEETGISQLTVEELQALADERGLEIEGTGAAGKVVKADLVKALTV